MLSAKLSAKLSAMLSAVLRVTLGALAVAAMLALAAPTLAMAEEEHHPPPGHPPAGHPPAKAFVPPHGPPGPPHAPIAPHPPGRPAALGHGPPGGAQFSYRGHMIERRHVDPFVYPHGWAYRLWAVGAILPPLFSTSTERFRLLKE